MVLCEEFCAHPRFVRNLCGFEQIYSISDPLLVNEAIVGGN